MELENGNFLEIYETDSMELELQGYNPEFMKLAYFSVKGIKFIDFEDQVAGSFFLILSASLYKKLSSDVSLKFLSLLGTSSDSNAKQRQTFDDLLKLWL